VDEDDGGDARAARARPRAARLRRGLLCKANRTVAFCCCCWHRSFSVVSSEVRTSPRAIPTCTPSPPSLPPSLPPRARAAAAAVRVVARARARDDDDDDDATTTTTTTTLFERVGGEDALTAAVDLFYEKNLADDRIASMFEGADMDALKKHQFNFMRVAFGGDASAYGGRGIFAAHKNLMLEKGLDERHFDCVAENLVATLRELRVAEDVVDDVVAVVSPLRELFDHEKNEEFKAAEAARERERIAAAWNASDADASDLRPRPRVVDGDGRTGGG